MEPKLNSFSTKTFQRKVAQSFLNSWKTSPQHDTSITCGRKIFKAHKVLLAASSGYFYDVFVKQEININRLVLNTIDPNIMEILLEYIYTGTITTDHTNHHLQTIIKDSLDILKMSDINKHRCDIIISSLCVQRYRYLWNLASHYQMKDMEKKIAKFVARNLEACMKNEEFVQLNLRQIIAVLSCEEIRMNSEMIQTSAMYNWITYNSPGREKYTTSLLSISKVSSSTRNRILTMLEEGYESKIFFDKAKKVFNCEKQTNTRELKESILNESGNRKNDTKQRKNEKSTEEKDEVQTITIPFTSSPNRKKLTKYHSSETGAFSILCSEGFDLEEESDLLDRSLQAGNNFWHSDKMNKKNEPIEKCNMKDRKPDRFLGILDNKISPRCDESVLIQNMFGLKPLGKKKTKSPSIVTDFRTKGRLQDIPTPQEDSTAGTFEKKLLEDKGDNGNPPKMSSCDNNVQSAEDFNSNVIEVTRKNSKEESFSKSTGVPEISDIHLESGKANRKKGISLFVDLKSSPIRLNQITPDQLSLEFPATTKLPKNVTTKQITTVNSPQSDFTVHKVTKIHCTRKDDAETRTNFISPTTSNITNEKNVFPKSLDDNAPSEEITRTASSIHHIKFSPKLNEYLSRESDPNRKAVAKSVSPGKYSIKTYPLEYPMYPSHNKFTSSLKESDKLRFLNLKERLENVLSSLRSKLEPQIKNPYKPNVLPLKPNDDVEKVTSTTSNIDEMKEDKTSVSFKQNVTRNFNCQLSDTDISSKSNSKLNVLLSAESLVQINFSSSTETKKTYLIKRNIEMDESCKEDDDLSSNNLVISDVSNKLLKQENLTDSSVRDQNSNNCLEFRMSSSNESSYTSKSVADKTTSYENVFHPLNGELSSCLVSPESPLNKPFKSETRLYTNNNYSFELMQNQRRSAGNDAFRSIDDSLNLRDFSPEEFNLSEKCSENKLEIISDNRKIVHTNTNCSPQHVTLENLSSDSNLNHCKTVKPSVKLNLISHSEPNIRDSNVNAVENEKPMPTNSYPSFRTFTKRHADVMNNQGTKERYQEELSETKINYVKDTIRTKFYSQCEDTIEHRRKCWNKKDMSYLPLKISDESNNCFKKSKKLSKENRRLSSDICKEQISSFPNKETPFDSTLNTDVTYINIESNGKEFLSNSSLKSDNSEAMTSDSLQQEHDFLSDSFNDRSNEQMDDLVKLFDYKELTSPKSFIDSSMKESSDLVSNKSKSSNAISDFEVFSSQRVSFNHHSGEVVAESLALLNFIYGDVESFSIQEVESFDKIFSPQIALDSSVISDSLPLEKTCKKLLEKVMQQNPSKSRLYSGTSKEKQFREEVKVRNKVDEYSDSVVLSSLHSLSDEELMSPSCLGNFSNRNQQFSDETVKNEKYSCMVWSSEKNTFEGKSINLSFNYLNERKNIFENDEQSPNRSETKKLRLNNSNTTKTQIPLKIPSRSVCDTITKNFTLDGKIVDTLPTLIETKTTERNNDYLPSTSKSNHLKLFDCKVQKTDSKNTVPVAEKTKYKQNNDNDDKAKTNDKQNCSNPQRISNLTRTIKLKNSNNTKEETKFERGKAIVFLAKNLKGEFVRLPYCLQKKEWLSPLPTRVPRPEDDYITFYHKQFIYYIGGTEGSITRYWYAAFEYNCSTDFLRQIPNLIVARAGAGLNMVKNSLYVIGGEGLNHKALAQVEKYDPAINCWKLVAPLLIGRVNMSVINFKQLLYVFGGTTVSNSFIHYPVLLSCERYDPSIDQWTAIADLPLHFERYNPLVTATNNRVFSLRIQNPDVVYRYSVTRDKWIILHDTKLSLRRIGFLLSGDNKLYAMGICGKVMYSFDLHSYQWSIESEFPDDMEWTVHAHMIDL